MANALTWRDLRSLITGALRASDFDPIMKNTKIIHDRPKRASVLFRKWKGGRDDESILKEKWLTFHDHKWLTFKRPLTTDDLYKLLDDFFEYFYSLNIDNLNNKQVFLEFKKKCAPIHELAQDILSYLFDYRILLMNSMLVDIFDKLVPSRRPSDPKYKLLTDVAIKEEVEKEEEKRIKAAMKKP